MASPTLIFQRLNGSINHEQVLIKLFQPSESRRYVLSVAYARATGISALENNLQKISNSIDVFVGIRNGITSVQAVLRLLKVGIAPIAVDVATTKIIFHPKIYVAYDKESAQVALGSANLTSGGLRENIEASALLALDLSVSDDGAFLAELLSTLDDLKSNFPQNVFPITDARQAVRLFQQGRLEDERVARLPNSSSQREGVTPDSVKPMLANTKKSRAGGPKYPKRSAVLAPSRSYRGILVWESKALAERSLNIPSGKSTNLTGDINLTQGSMTGLDFQTYFRHQVFYSLNWNSNLRSRNPHLERAEVDAEIITKGVSSGTFRLEVTHDPRTNTKSYRQKNAMTKLKWGAARPVVARRSLLGCTLRLYKKSQSQFAISID